LPSEEPDESVTRPADLLEILSLPCNFAPKSTSITVQSFEPFREVQLATLPGALRRSLHDLYRRGSLRVFSVDVVALLSGLL
jgi:hypothetical protein